MNITLCIISGVLQLEIDSERDESRVLIGYEVACIELMPALLLGTFTIARFELPRLSFC